MVDERESVTAKICAFVRAWHSNCSRQKIYDDYLAFDMLGKEEYEGIYELIQNGVDHSGWLSKEESSRTDQMEAHMGHPSKPLSKEEINRVLIEYFAPIPMSRIHFNESRLAAFAAENGKIQYVICGAGSDTFSFRNDNEDIEIFEVDHPDTQRYKLEKIKQLEWNLRKNVHYVSVDFEKERMYDKLLEAGFDPARKTFFSVLGVSYYLTLDVFTDLFRQMAGLSAPGSAVVFDYPIKTGKFPSRVARLEQITESLGEVMRGGFDYHEVSGALGAWGFQIDTYLSPNKVQSEYFCGRKDGMRAFENVGLVSATYRAG